MNGAMPRWHYWVSGFFLLDTMQAFGVTSRLVYGSWAGKGGDKITQSLNLLMIAASLTLFCISYRWTKKGFAAGTVLAFSAVGFLCLSALWSLDPPTTFRIAIVYLYVVLGAIGIARTMDADEYMHLLSWCCFLSAIASILLLVASPGKAHMLTYDQGGSGASDFIGIFPQKNVLGQVMATGALAALHDIRVARRRYLGKLCMLFVFLGMAYASKSTGALMAALLFCGISGFDSLWQRGGAARPTGVILAVLLAPVLIVAMLTPDTLLELIGKDPTLTGRTEIWAYIYSDIGMKPLLGWGYYVFREQINPFAAEISAAVHWEVPNAHTGLLEFLLDVGIVGTALFAFILIRIIVLAVRCLRTSQRALAISTISCCAGILLIGVSETVLLTSTQSSTPVLFITGLMCERALYVAKGLRRYRVADNRGQVGRSLAGSRRPLWARA
ncbi:MAG: O-antigen ligase family protein [Candidatus Korobacteraceae bacterium]